MIFLLLIFSGGGGNLGNEPPPQSDGLPVCVYESRLAGMLLVDFSSHTGPSSLPSFPSFIVHWSLLSSFLSFLHSTLVPSPFLSFLPSYLSAYFLLYTISGRGIAAMYMIFYLFFPLHLHKLINKPTYLSSTSSFHM